MQDLCYQLVLSVKVSILCIGIYKRIVYLR